MEGLTSELARFVAQPGFDAVPAEATRIIRSGFVDTIAAMLAGSEEPVTRLVRAHVRARRSALAEASVLFSDERAGAADAALINGVAGHALDYDDVALAGHPSTVLVPRCSQKAKRRGHGVAAIRAYLIGYEVWAELIGRESDSHHTQGMAPDRSVRHRGGRRGRGQSARPRRGEGAACARDRRQPGVRPDRQLRHHDQAAACWPRCQQRYRSGAAGAGRNDGLRRRIRARRRTARSAISARQRRPRPSGCATGQGPGDPRARPVGEEIPDVLRHSSGDRRCPRSCTRQPCAGRRRRARSGAHRCGAGGDVAQPRAGDRAGSQVQSRVRSGLGASGAGRSGWKS